MPRCSKCTILERAYAQQASVIEALTRALDAVRPAAAASGMVHAPIPQLPVLPDRVQQAVVRASGGDNEIKGYLEGWAADALATSLGEDEVARMVLEGAHD